jgi:hypothetical protein
VSGSPDAYYYSTAVQQFQVGMLHKDLEFFRPVFVHFDENKNLPFFLQVRICINSKYARKIVLNAL